MEDNFFFNISEDTLFNINKSLKDNNKNIINLIAKKKDYDNLLLIDEVLPPLCSKSKVVRKNLTEKERCFARLWKGGYGGKCQNIKKDYGLETECEFCNVHQKELLTKGKLRYGRIDELSPFRLPKSPDEPYKRCIHITNNKQCRCRMKDNSNYCTIHKNNSDDEDIAGIAINIK